MYGMGSVTRSRHGRRMAMGILALAGAGTLSLAGVAATGVGGVALSSDICHPGLASIEPQAANGYVYDRGYIRSFDCTPIVFNFFAPLDASPSHKVYTILEGPGWGSAGATTPDPELIADDYAELTWDPRGFGQSGGDVEIDSPAYEGRDVSSLISDVLAGSSPVAPDIATDTGGVNQPSYTNDTPGDAAIGQPAVGMTGVSYGGGIEFAVSAFDSRVKAMAPGWAWNNLDYSLFPGDVVKLGWDELLFGDGLAQIAATHTEGAVGGLPTQVGGTDGVQMGTFDPAVDEAEAKGIALGYPDEATRAWFLERSMAGYGTNGHVPDIPTLLIQGTVDTLFNLNDAWANFEQLTTANPGLPVKLIAFCGGHVSCPTGSSPTGAGYSDTASATSPIAPGESASTFTENATIAWFDTYLRGYSVGSNPVSATALPTVTYQDEDGNFYPATSFPTFAHPSGATWVSAPVSGTVVSHGIPTGTGPLGEDAVVTDGPTSSNDPGQFTVPVLTAGAGGLHITGEPHLSLAVTVLGNATELFFRLIDKNTGQVVDLQTTAQRADNLDLADNGAHATIPGSPLSFSIDMNGVAYELPAGDQLELQVSTSSVSFAPNRGAAVVQVQGTVSVPTMP